MTSLAIPTEVGLGQRIILKWFPEKWDVRVWTGLDWLRIGPNGGNF
jgi:hypothetical protein